MEFHQHHLAFNPRACRADNATCTQAYEYWDRIAYGHGKDTGKIFASSEIVWLANVRPYYKVWPSLYRPLTKIPLDIPMNKMALDEMIIALRFGIGHEPGPDAYKIVSAMLSITSSSTLGIIHYRLIKSVGTFDMGQWTWIYGNDASENLEDILWSKEARDSQRQFFNIPDDRTIPDVLIGEVKDDVERLSCRILLGVALLARDPDIFDRDVLSKDRRKYEQTGDERYVKKARKRGIVGWHLGRRLESSPHWRRPHFGLRWTGRGKTLPRIVPIKGAVVHRSKILDVPTGYTLPGGVDIEPKAKGED